MAEAHVKGLSELQKFLDALPAKMEANLMRGALRAGGNVIKKNAKGRVHVLSGRLARSFRVSTRNRGGVVTASIKAGPPDMPNLALWVEYGTKPHYISVSDKEKPVNISASRKAGRTIRSSMTTVNRIVLKIGRWFVGPTVHHPGATPRPFLRPAMDTQAGAALVAVGEYIKKRLTKAGLNAAHVEVEETE